MTEEQSLLDTMGDVSPGGGVLFPCRTTVAESETLGEGAFLCARNRTPKTRRLQKNI